MPKRKRSYASGRTSKRRRRKIYKVRRKRFSRTNFSRFLPFQPKSRITKHRWAKEFQLNPPAGGFHTQVLHLNSMRSIDPITTEQPWGFDQMNDLYTHSTVLGVRVTVVVRPVEANTTQEGIVYIKANTSSSGYETKRREMFERPGNSWKFISTKDNGFTTLSRKFSIRKLAGKPITDEDFSASGTADPNELFYLHIGCASADATADPGAFNVLVRMDFITKWTERKQVAGS